MPSAKKRAVPVSGTLAQKSYVDKATTGIRGFDLVTRRGLPRGRTTLVVGGPGAGKTLFALQALVNGAEKLGEPGIFVALEKTGGKVAAKHAALGSAFTSAEVSPRKCREP